ncbi:hypothetical protein CK203_000758 [Vitis vinifera]|uniref:DUF4228 domain-containing protein n=1 Tax=Vitis vinifera TaxID=29760 RepID=A0A438KR40_VITVI|nr:hypothetical protein CK203_000758 [Vitis vinifera]
MGNCQAAEAATVVIQHPGNKIERIYWSVSAHEVMTSNPGHYVALVVTSPTAKSENGTPLKQLKLLRPDDTLLIGQVYRLVSFEDVLKEFAAKKSVKLGKLLKERGGLGLEKTKRKHSSGSNSNQNPKPDSYGTVEPGLGPTECGRHFHSVVSLCWDQPFLRLCPGLWATVQRELFWMSRRFMDWEVMLAAAAAAAEAWEGIRVVVGGNGNQPYRALQKLELERTTTFHTLAFLVSTLVHLPRCLTLLPIKTKPHPSNHPTILSLFP